MDDRKRRWFLWGRLFAWLPTLPLLFSLLNSFRGITERHASGLGSVAGGLAEGYATFGLGLSVMLDLAAIVLLLRALSKEHWLRTVCSVVSISLSGVSLSLLGVYVWLIFVKLPHPH